jgi:hypothetical protein
LNILIYNALLSLTKRAYFGINLIGYDKDEKIQETFIDKYVFSWTNVVYNEEEAYLVNNMYKEKYGDYLIYIVSSDNDKVLKIIKG